MKRVVALLFFAVAAAAQTPTISAVVNVINYKTTLCPGLDVAIYGTNFGTMAPSVSISVGGKAASVVNVAPNQINAQLPVDAPVGATSMTITVGGIASVPFALTLAAYAPVFYNQSNDGTGTGPGLFLNAANQLITSANPAHPGDTVYGYMIGLGPTNPVTPTGATGLQNRLATVPVLMVGSSQANVLYAGTSPFAGQYQVNFQIPATASGVTPVSLSIAGTQTALPVTLAVVGPTAPAIGSVDTPKTGTAGITGAVSVTGWGVSWAGVQTIGMWRDPIAGETPSSNGLVFLANTAIVPKSRPDVAAAHPGYPGNDSGYGAQILTNQLPNTSGSGLGNGTYKIHVLVTSTEGEVTDIGNTTITTDNAHGVLPFGTIDTPSTGGTASGTSFVNFAWAVTPNPANVIPKDGSTMWVVIDKVKVGHPNYNHYRADIATLFPGLQNSNGAVGFYVIDTTKLMPGLHTIAWSVTDSAGNATGLGSRFFVVQPSATNAPR